jgi:GTP-binding protein
MTGKYFASQTITSENLKKQKPIQLSIVGRPNIGKSTFVNSLLKEHRVVANDMAGTTRDCI